MKKNGSKLKRQLFVTSKQHLSGRSALSLVHFCRVLTYLLCIFLFSTLTVSAQHAIPPEAWIEMRKMYQDKIPQTTIDQEIAALAGPQARRAGPKLIDRGPEALPAIHKALLNPDVKPRQAISLFQVVRAISDTSSVDVILELLQRDAANPSRRDALLVLSLLPATEKAAAYIITIATEKKEPWNTYRMAFTWFGMHHDPRGRPFAEAILSDPDPEKQSAGLYVLARLGDKSALEPITRILADGAPANSRDTLMLSLAHLVTPEEFEKRAPSSLGWSNGYKNSLLYSRFLHAHESEKPSICRDLLRSSLPGHLGTAVRCLLESGHASELRPFAALSLESPGWDSLVRNEIRKAGWHIVDTETEFRIKPGSK